MGQTVNYRHFVRQRIPSGLPTVRSVVRLSLVVVAATGLSGCFLADPDTSAIDVRHDTEQNLWLDDEPANGQSRRVSIGPHEYSKVGAGECTTGGLEAQTRSGRVNATLSRRWCPGENWIITAEGEFVLDRTP